MNRLRQISTDYALLKEAASLHDTILQMYYSLSHHLNVPIIIMQCMIKCVTIRTHCPMLSINFIQSLILSQKYIRVVLQGDQVAHQYLQAIKNEYGNDLKWLLPFPGDWHLLKNYQEVMLKIYFDAGLSDLAKCSGYLPNSVRSNFKRVHHFLLETWKVLSSYVPEEPGNTWPLRVHCTVDKSFPIIPNAAKHSSKPQGNADRCFRKLQ